MEGSGGAAENVADIAAAEAAAVVEHEARGLVERDARQVEAGTNGIEFLEMRGSRNELLYMFPLPWIVTPTGSTANVFWKSGRRSACG